ncbi:hypothetical protein R1flu_007793 [Riccia fluitans]|uniref:Uncharacterized protein n=1 Tax=Riccia fluitans TaxID=41844 RepID=A0ABD1Z131_9MARC
MSRNIHLYHLRGKEQSMISMGLIGFKEGDILLSLRKKLEGEKKTPQPQVNHHVETDAACAIVEKVNGEELSQKKPFITEVRSGAKGRPKKFDPKNLKRQRCIDSFFVGVQSSGSVSNPSSIENYEKEPGEVHSDLSLLCWGFWFMSVVYGGKVYDVKPLLDDQKRGYICACYNIPKTMSFRLQCTKEDDATVKRGSRDSLLRIRLDYLTILELRAQAQCRSRARRKEQIELFRLKRRVCTLMSRTCKVAQIVDESTNRKDIDSNFEEVAKILTAAKVLHGITRDVAVFLAEDETRVKPTMRWEARHDTLIGFCGDKDNHVCKLGLEVKRWDKCCRQAKGLVLGHASDGDARRRKLMLEDYFGSEGQRWTVGWDGWVLSGIVLDFGDVYALGDQDPIHNGKKMINPLDKSSYPIVLGDFHACLEHVQVFRDKLLGMALALHLLGSDSCEKFFSRIGGMRGYERNYDFGDLLDCASGLNRLALLEYGEEFVKLPKAHVKQRPLWAKLHPLPPGHAKPDLSDFARLATDDQIIEALKVGLQKV